MKLEKNYKKKIKIKKRGKNNKKPLKVSRSVTPTARHELGEGLKKKKIKVFKLARHRTSLYGADRLLLIATLNCWRNFTPF